ncbi:MAG TPA: ABC transporter permease [Chitinophagaceae bacterium]|nr:MAG: ABC transporter [Bacteroidetes bacterium OLB11]HMN31861.1 ABC transporter permease [Chitinophagaceae bacterium]
MIQFVLKRVLQSVFVLFGVVTIVFVLFFVMLPADTARLTVGQRTDAKTIDNIRKELYLDQPIWRQYFLYLNDLSPLSIHKNNKEEHEKYHYREIFTFSSNDVLVVKSPYLRRSYQTKKEVNAMLMDAFPGTFILATLSIIIASLIGMFLGIIAALNQNTFLDTGSVFASVIGISAPSFFAGIVIAYIFGFLLSDYTGLSIVSPMWDYDPYTGKHFMLKSLILPVITLSIRPMAIITQITRSSMLDVMNQDYIRTAYAKGLNKTKVIAKHALRNALNPVVTSISGWFAELLAGSFFIEYIFGWKGIGKITVDALNKFDFPVVAGAVLMTALIFIVINIFVDIIYTLIDPRVKI